MVRPPNEPRRAVCLTLRGGDIYSLHIRDATCVVCTAKCIGKPERGHLHDDDAIRQWLMDYADTTQWRRAQRADQPDSLFADYPSDVGAIGVT